MIGVSYEGTTANMVAARGDDVPGARRRIVPIAAISRWYGYAYEHGVRYFLNSKRPTDEGFDTPLGFDFGFGRTVPADPAGRDCADVAAPRAPASAARSSTRSRATAARPTTTSSGWSATTARTPPSSAPPTLVVHGWQDYNVKQEEGTDLFEALPVDDPHDRGRRGRAVQAAAG